MKQIFYTQEGKPYTVKTATAYFDNSVVAAYSTFRGVYINNPSGIVDQFGLFLYNQRRPIIPISYSFGAIDSFNVNVANQSCCYFSAATGFTFLPNYRNALAKIYPFVERVFYTDANNFNYIVRYNQITFAEADFLPVNAPLSIYMHAELDNAMVGPVGNLGTLPAETYDVAVTFTYFELE